MGFLKKALKGVGNTVKSVAVGGGQKGLLPAAQKALPAAQKGIAALKTAVGGLRKFEKGGSVSTSARGQGAVMKKKRSPKMC